MEPTAMAQQLPSFTLIESHDAHPWRSRGVFAGYLAFSGDRGAALVSPELMTELRKRAQLALPAETGGLLAGRVFRDERGAYSVVLGFQEAPANAGRPGQFALTGDGTHRLKQTLSAAEPACDVIGWYHSHSQPMPYSSTDFANQALWTDPQHIGLLVFARGSELGLVYQGPGAHLLPFDPDRQQRRQLEAATDKRAASPPQLPPLPAQLATTRTARPPQRRLTIALPLLTLALLIAVLVLQLVELSRGHGSSETPSRSIPPATYPARTPERPSPNHTAQKTTSVPGPGSPTERVHQESR